MRVETPESVTFMSVRNSCASSGERSMSSSSIRAEMTMASAP